MRITHICLTGSFTDGWSYQENILTKFHRKMGHSVTMITSEWIKNNKGSLEKHQQNEYVNDDGVNIIRLKLKGKDNIEKKIKKYSGVYDSVKKTNPDILFIHGCQFLDIKEIVVFAKEKKALKIFVDNHADFSNSATNWISKFILHKMLWKRCAQIIEPYTYKFYGVLPARVDFLRKMYDLPSHKVELLVMGADDEFVNTTNDYGFRHQYRTNYNIADDEFLIVTGGKIDFEKKQTLLLMDAVRQLKNKKIKLIIFGSIDHDIRKEFNCHCDGEVVQYIGWLDSAETYKCFDAADLVVFPGRHSVFWEQVAGQGIPMIIKYWDGTTHIDLNGNLKYLNEDSVVEIKCKIEELYGNKEEYRKMKEVAQNVGGKYFSYSDIARRSLE